MKRIKLSVLLSLLLSAGAANAELVSNVPLEQSRFELMSSDVLLQHAQQGNRHAQFYLAKNLQNGIGMSKNIDDAIYWYTKAAENGTTPAQLNLGMIYATGEDIAVDEQKARFWLEKAVLGGDNRASFVLAMIEEKQDKLVEAYKWYDLSARDGMLNDNVRDTARNRIGELAVNLSSEDIANARNQANTWYFSK